MSKNFKDYKIAACFIKKLENLNIRETTDIQSKIIGRLASEESVFFSSATGTGKTFAYLLPFLSKLQEVADIKNPPEPETLPPQKGLKNFPVLLIIAPTLELCSQISNEIDFLIKNTSIRSLLAIGSVNPQRQIETIKKIKPEIIIGSPSRLLVLAKKKIIKFEGLRFLVLDEADRLVSEEMSDDTSGLCKIIMNNARKNGSSPVITACSATLNFKCREKLMIFFGGEDIPFIESGVHEILRDKIEHWAIFSDKRRKDQTLRSLLSALKSKKGKKSKIKVLVFTSRSDEASLTLSRLLHHRIQAAGLFGKINKKPLSSQERKAALDSFRDGGTEVLVSTDLAARGLDIEGVTHIVALDVPSDSEAYIHRCGRTARAGKCGTMITIGDETQMRLLALLEKKLKIKVLPKELHYGEVCAPLPVTEDDE